MFIIILTFGIVAFVFAVAALTIKLSDIIEEAVENHRKTNE